MGQGLCKQNGDATCCCFWSQLLDSVIKESVLKSCCNLDSACCFKGDSMRTNIQLDFGDGTAVSYSNLSWTQEGIRHVYRSAGIFRVTAQAENNLGFDTSSLYLHVTCRFHTYTHKRVATSVFIFSLHVVGDLFQVHYITFTSLLRYQKLSLYEVTLYYNIVVFFS